MVSLFKELQGIEENVALMVSKEKKGKEDTRATWLTTLHEKVVNFIQLLPENLKPL